MNRTQQLTCDWLQYSGLTGDALLLEALLRRGFLAYRDDHGVWLGTGSHPEDIAALRLIDGLAIEPLTGHKERLARFKLRQSDVPAMGVATEVVAILENHHGGHSLWTGYGLPDYLGKTGWDSYRKMTWGTKLAICPTGEMRESQARNALDLGVGLLVKAFPLARVATRACCDGHGKRPVWIAFITDWDSRWGKAVFDGLKADTPNSTWDWNQDLHIAPMGGYGDAEVLGMLSDIQVFSRLLLHQPTVDKIGRARARALIALGEAPTGEDFSHEAQCQLAMSFA